MAILLSVFALFIVTSELATGQAIVGWTGNNMTVDRRKSPGPYWFSIAIHSLIGIGIPLLYVFTS